MSKKAQSGTVWSSKKKRHTASRAWRSLCMEPLEARELLAVSFMEYQQIREWYSGFDLASDWEQVRIVDLEELTGESLMGAVAQATSTEGDDLIVVRTSSESGSIAMGDDTLKINYDSNRFGSLTIVGWGETLLELTGRTTMINVSAGDVQLGGMKLTGQSVTATGEAFELLTSEANANLSTLRMLFVRDSLVEQTSQGNSAHTGSSLFSATVPESKPAANGYYSVEFQLNQTDNNPSQTKWAYVTGLDSSGVQKISDALAGGYGSDDPFRVIGNLSGDFLDAEKANEAKDSDLCWAATAANMLWYSGWAHNELPTSPSPSFSSEDSVLAYFENYWPNGSGNIGTANEWFINGKDDVSGGAFYNDVSYGSLGGSMSVNKGNKFANMVERLRADNAIGLSVGWFREGPEVELTSRHGGHAVTLWGYVYDTAQAGTEDYYCACIIADPDDNKYNGALAPNVLVSCDIQWDELNSEYCFDAYKNQSDFGWLETFYWLVPNTPLAHKPQLDRPSISLSSTVQTNTNTATVNVAINQITHASSYELEYSTNNSFATDETTQKFFEYSDLTDGVYSVSSLETGTEYYFRVRALGDNENYRDSEWSATKSITTETVKTPLATPVLEAIGSDTSFVTVSLKDGDGNDGIANASGYKIWFSSIENDFSNAPFYTFDPAGSYTLHGLKAGTTWYFQAVALGDGQHFSDSAKSEVVSRATTGSASSDDRTKGNIVTTLLDSEDGSDGLISLREAISYCGSNGTTTDITFAENLRGGTIVLSGMNNYSSPTTSLLIMKSLTITGLVGEGEDGTPGITIDGNRTCNVFDFNNQNSDGTRQINAISNLVVTGGALVGEVHGGGGIEVYQSELEITNCVVQGNSIYYSGTGTRVASAYGAGIYARDSKVIVRDSIIRGNTIDVSSTKQVQLYGAGIYCSSLAEYSQDYPSSLTLERTLLEKNVMTGRSTAASVFAYGSAVSNSGSSVLSISDCEFLSNRVELVMENATSVDDTQLSANVRGGVVSNESTGMNKIDRTIIQYNVVEAQAVSHSVQTLAGVYGTGIYNEGFLVVSNSLIADNEARTQANSDEKDEFAQVHGSALYVGTEGELNLIGSTLSGNEGSASTQDDSGTVHGALYVDCDSKTNKSGTAKVYNTIIAQNFATHGGDIVLKKGASIYGANNLADFNGWSSSSINNIDFNTNDDLFVDSSAGNYRLASSSFAALKADPGYAFLYTAAESWSDLTDLAGNFRIAGAGIDIGAYELDVTGEDFSMIDVKPQMSLTPLSDSQQRVEIVAVDRVEYYTLLYRKSGDELWETGLSTRSLRFNLNQLESNTEYEFMVVGVQETVDLTHTLMSDVYHVTTQPTGTPETPSLVVTTALDIEDPNDGAISFREAVGYLSEVSGTDKKITFAPSLAGKTIELKRGVVSITQSVTIDASDLNNKVALSGEGVSSILNINGSSTAVTLKNLAFIDGYSETNGGAVYSNCSSLTVENCLFADNQALASAQGGGALFAFGGTLIVKSSEFSGNSVDSSAGSSFGGAIWAYSDGTVTDSATVTDSVFVNNTLKSSSGVGGAIGSQAALTIERCVFTENSASFGGAIWASATLTVTDSLLERNVAGTYYGGGIYASGTEVSVSGTSFVANKAQYGGGIYASGAAASVSGTSFVANEAQWYGGGFYGSGDITKSVFRTNKAGGGGGIFLDGGTSRLNECLIVKNRAESSLDNINIWGGGAYLRGAATITNCTIAENYAVYGGGLGCGWSSPAPLVQNSIIVGNTSSTDSNDLACVSNAWPTANNVLCGSKNSWANGQNVTVYDSNTALFVNAEAGDYSLVRCAGSQAVDKGDNSYVTSTTDLAGANRIYGTKVDLGAYEVQERTRNAVCSFTINENEVTEDSITITIVDVVPGDYEVQCSTSPDFTNPVFSRTVSGAGPHTITGLAAGQNYFIQVRTAATSSNDASIWTPIQIGTTIAAKLAQPSLTASLGTEEGEIMFSWSPVSGAIAYLVEYSQDEEFTGTTRQIVYEDAGAYRVDHVTPLGTWYFRVTALGAIMLRDSDPSMPQMVAQLDGPEAILAKTEYSVEIGCHVYLSGSGTDKNEHEIEYYYWDINGDGKYDYEGENVWVDSKYLVPNNNGRATVDFWVVNDLGEKSPKKKLYVDVTYNALSANVNRNTFSVGNGEVLVLRIDMPIPGRENVVRWQVNWGDNSENDIQVLASSIVLGHYFTGSGPYDITLTVTLSNGLESSLSLFRFKSEVPGASSQSVSGVVEESLPVALFEPEVVLDPLPNQTGLDKALESVMEEFQPCCVAESVLIDLVAIEKSRKKRLWQA